MKVLSSLSPKEQEEADNKRCAANLEKDLQDRAPESHYVKTPVRPEQKVLRRVA